jgi:ATP synthase F1 gamma subunit
MAGLRDLKRRIGSVQSIEKVTTAMSNIAGAKLTFAMERLAHARAISTNLEKVVFSIVDEPEDFVAKAPRYYVVGSDAGLCGSVNTLLNKHVVNKIKAETSADVKPSLFLSGNKILKNFNGNGFSVDHAVTNIYKYKTFSQTMEYTAELVEKDATPDSHTFVYQGMISNVKMDIKEESVPTAEAIKAYYGPIGVRGDLHTSQNLHEFLLLCNMWRVTAEQEASELYSRQTAMQNAAKAAGDMIAELELKYRKLRQAKITTEIIEISTGAQAVMAED